MLTRFRTALIVVVAAAATAWGCNGNSGSPLAPSSSAGWGARATGALISGVAVDGNGHARQGLTVAVAGTNRAAAVGDDGSFQIPDVPAGTVRLQFRASGIDATTTIEGVSSTQAVEIVVQVDGTTAEIVDEQRTEKITLCHLSDDDRYHRIDVSVNAEPAHRAHGDGAIGDPVPADPTKTFDARCRAVGPSVAIVKSTNGEDANEAPGPSITIGSTVTWTYEVTNDGTAPLTQIAVSDDRGVAVSCNGQTTLDPGESMTCTGTGIVTTEGQYRNVATVTANWSNSSGSGTVTDSDPSHYLGISPLEIEKLTNGEDADFAPGPTITVGDPVAWEYVVKNIGTVPLTGLSVVDDQGVAVNCGGQTTLAPGATVTCTASGVAVEGQYRNVGTATATWTAGTFSGTVSASDASHYLGRSPDDDGEGPKVSLCHRTGAGFYVLINVSVNAEPAHLAHGDGRPGGAVPNQPGRSFTASCGVQ